LGIPAKYGLEVPGTTVADLAGLLALSTTALAIEAKKTKANLHNDLAEYIRISTPYPPYLLDQLPVETYSRWHYYELTRTRALANVKPGASVHGSCCASKTTLTAHQIPVTPALLPLP
jgi:hypothetical protein